MATLQERTPLIATSGTLVPEEGKALARLSDQVVKSYGNEDAESLLVPTFGMGAPETAGTVTSFLYIDRSTNVPGVYVRISRDPIMYSLINP